MMNSVTSRRPLMALIVAVPGAVLMASQAEACPVVAVSAAPDGVGGAGIGTGPVGPSVAKGASIGVGVVSVGAGIAIASGDLLPPFSGTGAGFVAEPVSPLVAELTAIMFR